MPLRHFRLLLMLPITLRRRLRLRYCFFSPMLIYCFAAVDTLLLLDYALMLLSYLMPKRLIMMPADA